MKRLLLQGCLGWVAIVAAHAVSLPPVTELLGLVRTNLSSLTPEQLAAPTSEVLLARLGAQVHLLEDYEEPEPPLTSGAGLVGSEIYDGGFACLRFNEISPEAAQAAAARLEAVRGTNTVAGCVLDLRFAGGRDFAAAGALAGQFLTANTPLFDSGEGILLSPICTNRFAGPLAVLVNRQTRGAAEALAAVLRQSGSALLIGDRTAGEDEVFRDFTLSTGQRLRLTVAVVRTASGEPIASSGLVPDLRLELTPEVERGYLRDPFTPIRSTTNSLTATNSITTVVRVRRRFSEADLVRERSEGAVAARPVAPEPAAPVIRDPVLARGLDFLKGQARMRP